MKVGDFLKKQLQKAGVDITAEALQPAFAIDTDLPDENATAADKALLTVQAALSNSEVNSTLRQRILAGADAKMDTLITELGLTVGDDFPAEKNTYEKIGKLVKLAQDAGKKAAGATSKEGTKEWELKEADYNRQIRDLKTAQTAKDTEISTLQRTGKITNRVERRLLAKAKELNLPEDMDIDLKLQIVTGAIGGDLQKKGIRWELDENENLIVVDKDGKPAYNPSDNVAYEPNNLIDGALAQNKLLKINGGNQQQSSSTPGAFNIPAGDTKLSAIKSDFLHQVTAMPE